MNKICKICDNKYQKRTKFCSRVCANKNRKNNYLKKRTELDNISKICLMCKTQYFRKQKVTRYHFIKKQLFCSGSCGAIYRHIKNPNHIKKMVNDSKNNEEICKKKSEGLKKLYREKPEYLALRRKMWKSTEYRLKKSLIAKRIVKEGKCIFGDGSKGYLRTLSNKIRGIHNYRIWRTSVIYFGNKQCAICNSMEKITAHHIKPLNKIIKENNILSIEDSLKCDELWDVNNGQILCEKCHMTIDPYYSLYMKKR